MINLEQLTEYKTIDISSYTNQNNVNTIIRSYLIQYGKVVFVDIVIYAKTGSTKTAPLFENLLLKPKFLSELSCFAENISNWSSRANITTSGTIQIAESSNELIAISGSFMI